MTRDVKFYTALMKGDWSGAWDQMKAYAATTQTTTGVDLVSSRHDARQYRTWFGDTGTAFSTGFTAPDTAYTTWLTNFSGVHHLL
jgi:hypothetical protein